MNFTPHDIFCAKDKQNKPMPHNESNFSTIKLNPTFWDQNIIHLQQIGIQIQPLLQEKHELCVNSIAKQTHNNIKEV